MSGRTKLLANDQVSDWLQDEPKAFGVMYSMPSPVRCRSQGNRSLFRLSSQGQPNYCPLWYSGGHSGVVWQCMVSVMQYAGQRFAKQERLHLFWILKNIDWKMPIISLMYKLKKAISGVTLGLLIPPPPTCQRFLRSFSFNILIEIDCSILPSQIYSWYNSHTVLFKKNTSE